MRSLCLLFALLFLAAQATAESAVEETDLSLQGEEMEPEGEIVEGEGEQAEEPEDTDQVLLDENFFDDFFLTKSTPGTGKVTYKRCTCKKTCPKANRAGRCLRNYIGYTCCRRVGE